MKIIILFFCLAIALTLPSCSKNGTCSSSKSTNNKKQESNNLYPNNTDQSFFNSKDDTKQKTNNLYPNNTDQSFFNSKDDTKKANDEGLVLENVTQSPYQTITLSDIEFLSISGNIATYPLGENITKNAMTGIKKFLCLKNLKKRDISPQFKAYIYNEQRRKITTVKGRIVYKLPTSDYTYNSIQAIQSENIVFNIPYSPEITFVEVVNNQNELVFTYHHNSPYDFQRRIDNKHIARRNCFIY